MIISNKSSLSYNAVIPNGEVIHGNTESNTVNTEILSYFVPKTIRCDKTFVKEGDSVHDSVTVTNNSTTKLFDNFFIVPELKDASFVVGSVKINGVAQPNYDPVIGFHLPDLNVGESIVIEYDVKTNAPVTTSPLTHFATLNYTVKDPVRGDVNYSENTDVVSLNVISDKISVVKSVDKSYAVKGEQLHYAITISNIGNVPKTDMIFRDPIPAGATFVSNSVKINGSPYSGYNPDNGFTIQNLAPSETLTVEFDVKVN